MRHKVHWRHSRQPSMKAWNTDTTGGTAIHLLTAFGSNASVAHCQCWEALTWLPLLPRTTSCAQTLRQVSSYDPSRPKFHAGNPKGRICSNEQLFETMTVVWQPCGNSSATALAGCKFVLYHGGSGFPRCRTEVLASHCEQESILPTCLSQKNLARTNCHR